MTRASEQQADTPDCPVDIATFGCLQPQSDPTNLIHFGERISTFRTLLKRYNLDEYIPLVHTGTSGVPRVPQYSSGTYGFFRRLYPQEPGHLDSLTAAKVYYSPFQLTATTLRPYMMKNTPLMVYLSRCYAGRRGGVRWMLQRVEKKDTSYFTHMSINRESQPTVVFGPYNWYYAYSSAYNFSSLVLEQAINYGKQLCGGGFSGIDITDPDVQPLMSVEVPFYSKYRFDLPRHIDPYDESNDLFKSTGYVFRCLASLSFPDLTTANNPANISGFWSYCSAAEDFQLSWWMGAPPMTLHTIPDIEPSWNVVPPSPRG